MSYASVMVPVDLGPGATDRVTAAASLADRFGGFLIGVAAQQPFIPTHPEGLIADATIIDAEQQRVQEELAEVERLFRKATGTRNQVLWRSALESAPVFAREQARAADIMVLSRHGRDDPADWRFGVAPGDVVLELGRPIVVVPPGMASITGKRIVVAWKDTREARRAVWDALPFLKEADEVVVVAITNDTRRAGAVDVAEYLIRHGVIARVRGCECRDETVGEELLKVVGQEGADLIVAGAYGHTRMREWMFGGVTRDFLDHSPVPCLMAH